MNRAAVVELSSRLWMHLTKKRKNQLGAIFLLMLLVSFAEVVGIGAVLPFLAVLASPEKVFSNAAFAPAIEFYSLKSPQELLFPVTLLFCCVALLAGGLRTFYLWCSTRLAFEIGAELSRKIYENTLFQPYAVHCARNSSEVIAAVTSKVHAVIYNCLMPMLTLVNSALMLVVITVAVFLVNPVMAVLAFAGFGLIYVFVFSLTRDKYAEGSRIVEFESVRVVKILQEGLGGIRDILLDGSQKEYLNAYSCADVRLRWAQGRAMFMSDSPRYGVEALGMVLIAALAYMLSNQEEGMATALPVLGAFALGAQRMLPVLQQAYAAWSNIRTGQESVLGALALLEETPMLRDGVQTSAMAFNDAVEFRSVSFAYDGCPLVLDELDLVIRKGSRVGFVGPTGSGKSTLIDILMGLLSPTNGEVNVDGIVIASKNVESWQKNIAHVPQDIFLSDASITANIAFGVPAEDVDMQRVKQAAVEAQISAAIELMPNGYETLVGERGIRLSGGQRQRIGIARALYKRAKLIILDEATSALDTVTESAVMESVAKLNKELTIVMVAHRHTTLASCDVIHELRGGKIHRSGTYDEIFSKAPVSSGTE